MAYRKQAAAQISVLLLQQWPIDLTCASLQPVNHFYVMFIRLTKVFYFTSSQ